MSGRYSLWIIGWVSLTSMRQPSALATDSSVAMMTLRADIPWLPLTLTSATEPLVENPFTDTFELLSISLPSTWK